MDAEFGSLETDELLNVYDEVVGPGRDLRSVFNGASAGDTIYVGGDHSTLQDRLNVPADDVTLIIGGGATVGYASDAAPTTVTITGGENAVVVYNDGQQGFTLINHGTIIPNDSSLTNNARGVYFDGRTTRITSGGILNYGTVEDAWTGVFFEQADSLRLEGVDCRNIGGGAIGGQFSDGITIRNVRCDGGTEVIDLNNAVTNYDIETVRGLNITEELIDINISPDGVIKDVRAVENCSQGINIANQTGSTTDDNNNNITIRGVYGTFSGDVMRGIIDDDIDCQNVSIKGIEATSTSGNVVQIEQHHAGQWDNLQLEGHAITEGGGHAVTLGALTTNGAGTSENIRVDLTVEAPNATKSAAAVRADFENVNGTIRSRNAGHNGAIFSAPDSDIELIVMDAGNTGVSFSATNCQIRGRVEQSGGTDWYVAGDNNKIDVVGSVNDAGTGNVQASYA